MDLVQDDFLTTLHDVQEEQPCVNFLLKYNILFIISLL